MNFSRPNIVVSKCIEFDHCRYNGDMIHSSAVLDLKEFVNFIPVCPEVEIGLGVPRKTVRIVEIENKRLLMQSGSETDLTQKMYTFADSFLNSLDNKTIDGFLLKTSSPSCGFKDSKVYKSIEKGSSVRKNSSGFFTEKAEDIFPDSIFETEGRLENFVLREEFYTKIFISAMLKEVLKRDNIRELIEFHTKNKYLIMSYSSAHLKKLGNITANREKKSVAEVYEAYRKEFCEVLKRNRRTGSNINVLLHISGYFSEKLKKEEKQFFLDKVEQYRNKMIPLSSVLSLLESWAIRFDEEYLKTQTIFNPFPKQLIRVTDSGKGREF